MKDRLMQELVLLRHSIDAAQARVNDELGAIKQEIDKLLPEDEPVRTRPMTREELLTPPGEEA